MTELLLGKVAGGGNLDLVFIEPFHTLFAGQTNLSGKTTTIRALLPDLVDAGYTVIILDTKPTVREFEGYHEIPVCYQETMDSLVLLGLVESILRRRLTNFYATLGRAMVGAKGPKDIIINLRKLSEGKGGWVADAAWTLADGLERLQVDLERHEMVPHLQVVDGTVNVMAVNGLSDETQQLVMKTVFEEALHRHNRRTVLVIDEAWRFLPQEYSSACKRAVQDVVTQGAKTELFVWLATQFLAPTDKDAMKSCANKLLGRQDQDAEVQHTVKAIPMDVRKKFEPLIMKLKPGEFIFVPKQGTTQRVHVIPPEMRGVVAFVPEPLEEDWSEFGPRLETLEAKLK